ncbi:hypothetical protein GWZ69_13480 [Vibrio cholerae]|nr:hypothetical protein [Vibrio cholerae]
MVGSSLHISCCSDVRASAHNKRLKRDCQRVAFPVPLSLSGYGCCV